MDYFFELLYDLDAIQGIKSDIAEIINEDIKAYRNYCIKQYNYNKEKATDLFCVKKFLNEYCTAINVFGLHKEFNCRGSFNKFISSAWSRVKEIENL